MTPSTPADIRAAIDRLEAAYADELSASHARTDAIVAERAIYVQAMRNDIAAHESGLPTRDDIGIRYHRARQAVEAAKAACEIRVCRVHSAAAELGRLWAALTLDEEKTP